MASNRDEIRYQLLNCIQNFQDRCLTKSVQWCCDLLISMGLIEDNHINMDNSKNSDTRNTIIDTIQQTKITMARQLIYQKEYKRAAHYVKDIVGHLPKFIHVYAHFLDYERKRWENYLKTDGIVKFDRNIKVIELTNLNELLITVEEPDSYILYVHALIQKEMGCNELAMKLLIESINTNHLNWPAWKELAYLIPNYDYFTNIIRKLPDNWVQCFFIIECCTNLNRPTEDCLLNALQWVQSNKLHSSNYYKLKMAQLTNIKGNINTARSMYESLRQQDPYILDGIDLYSNILFTEQDIMSLSKLVKELFEHSKYRPETCFAAGNLYNAAGFHEKSANYFKQTIRLNPNWIHAWTLLGHEYIELKDLGSAVVSYRKALELNPNEYRAWYGLGLVYELLRKPNEAIVMFEKALSIRPNDSRILYAVATSSLKIKDTNRAIWTLRRCIEVGDNECNAAFTLAGLICDTNKDEAAALYLEYLKKYDERGLIKEDDVVFATVFLMNYYFQLKQYPAAELYARRATRYNQCLREAEYILKELDTISRNQTYETPLPTRLGMFLDQLHSGDDEENEEGNHSDPMDISFT